MSLVYEALRKAEREKSRKTGSAAVAPHSVESPAAPRPAVPPATAVAAAQSPAPKAVPATPSTQRSHLSLLTVLIGCVGFVAIVAIVYLVSSTAERIRETSAPVAPSQVETAPAAVKPTPPKPRGQSPSPPGETAVATENQTATAQSIDTSAFKVSGIMKDPEGKYCAVLNGRVVYEEHFVDGATVRRIERDRVTVDIRGREAVLRLF